MISQTKILNTWNNFKEEYTSAILPIYFDHEQTFDFIGIHGRRHITRSLIFAEIIGRFYYVLGADSLDFEGIRIAISFHDSGREGNGVDYWEVESGDNCKRYLLNNGKTEEYSKQISNMIPQKKSDIKTREEQIVYDVDVIEIIRVFSDRASFRKEELYFLGENDLHRGFSNSILELQDEFLLEFWTFLESTEEDLLVPGNESFINEYINIFRKDKEKYKLMNLVYDFELKN